MIAAHLVGRASGGRSAVLDPTRRHDAHRYPKQRRIRAQVAKLTDLADLSRWPEGTRLVVRREPLQPRAQRSLFESENFRYWGSSPTNPDIPHNSTA